LKKIFDFFFNKYKKNNKKNFLVSEEIVSEEIGVFVSSNLVAADDNH